MTSRLKRFVAAFACAVSLSALAGVPASAEPAPEGGFFALSREEARGYVLPSDVRLVESFSFNGLQYDRYEQVTGPHQAEVLGAEITLVSDGSGPVMVAGTYFSGLHPSNSVAVGREQAETAAHRAVGQGQREGDLVVDPISRKHLYRVETQRDDARYFHFVDAQTGEVVDSYDAITTDHSPTAACGLSLSALLLPPCGVGVEFDRGSLDDVKSLAGLTTRTADGSGHHAVSADGRQTIYDTSTAKVATDPDDAWTTLGDASPSQQAVTDAIYYTAVTDDYLNERLGFDFVKKGRMPFRAVAHYGTAYNNAFWNGSTAYFGDGDQVQMRELTTLDVVAHEFAHGVTDFTSDLVYRDQSGALNESFSDIVGNSAEYYAEPLGREPAARMAPDWLIGEDLMLTADVAPGFRNMGDPEEDLDPDHYTELLTGSTDNGYVHSNSAIPNHAFYLLVNGGLNASCAAPATHNAAHCSDTTDTQDNNLAVTPIGLEKAEDIWFMGVAALSSRATMCDARRSIEASAVSLFGAGSTEATAAKNAWLAVGLTDKTCPTTTTKGGGKRPR